MAYFCLIIYCLSTAATPPKGPLKPPKKTPKRPQKPPKKTPKRPPKTPQKPPKNDLFGSLFRVFKGFPEVYFYPI
jgi:hypothetical protein